MTPAVVHLTCPSCGGRIDGVASTNVEQTIKCSFCSTELHIPKIGGDLARRLPHAEPFALATSDDDPREPRRSYIIIAIGLLVFFAIVCSFFIAMR